MLKAVRGIGRRPEREDAMRLHKFFAYATVMCFLLTMYTGYNRN